MEDVPHPTLRDRLSVAFRFVPGSDAVLPKGLANAGSWLRHYHAREDGAQLAVC